MHGSLPHHQNMAHAFFWRFEHLKKAATPQDAVVTASDDTTNDAVRSLPHPTPESSYQVFPAL
ncbi:MAG: hypothetical protein PVG89_17355 [Gammaproteobacteria bacterium]|jgi:hypothetical protein